MACPDKMIRVQANCKKFAFPKAVVVASLGANKSHCER